MTIRRSLMILAVAGGLAATSCGGSAATAGGASSQAQPMVEVSPSAPAGFLPYSNTSKGFFIAYPKSWTDRGASGTEQLFMAPASSASDTFRENVNVEEEDVPSGTTLAQYSAGAMSQVRSAIGSMHLVTEKDVTIAGQPGHEIVYTGIYTNQGTQYSLEWMQAWTLSQTQAFVITYTGDPKDFSRSLPTAQRMVATFAVT